VGYISPLFATSQVSWRRGIVVDRVGFFGVVSWQILFLAWGAWYKTFFFLREVSFVNEEDLSQQSTGILTRVSLVSKTTL